jgi:hypothetical protein
MVSEDSSSCLKKSATGRYPDTNEPSPHLNILKEIIKLSFYLRLGLPNSVFPSGFLYII